MKRVRIRGVTPPASVTGGKGCWADVGEERCLAAAGGAVDDERAVGGGSQVVAEGADLLIASDEAVHGSALLGKAAVIAEFDVERVRGGLRGGGGGIFGGRGRPASSR
jgi:hypothetical protein